VLTLWSDRAESLWEEALPVEVRELPEDLAALDRQLSDAELLGPLVEHWRREVVATGRAVLTDGRPTIAMETYVRLMVLKRRYRRGYRTLVAEVWDSIHLRRFCRISLSGRVPDESTIRKLTRRIGPETVAELTRKLIAKATRERRFRPRAVPSDSTVVEADVKYPTDSDLAARGVRALAREGRRLAERLGEQRARVRDRSRALGRRLRAITGTIRRRSGEAKAEVLRLTAETGELLQRSVGEARGLAAAAGRKARGRGGREAEGHGSARAARRPLRQARPTDRAAHQGRANHRLALGPGHASDPQGQPRQAERVRVRGPAGGGDREHPPRGARPDPAGGYRAGQSARERAAARHRRGAGAARALPARGSPGRRLSPGPTNEALSELQPGRVFISGRQEPGSKRTRRRMRRYRTGAEGRISHLKRRYGLGRSRLKGHQGQRIWTEWSILAHNADLLAVRAG
jgi:transposase, IS5 family